MRGTDKTSVEKKYNRKKRIMDTNKGLSLKEFDVKHWRKRDGWKGIVKRRSLNMSDMTSCLKTE